MIAYKFLTSGAIGLFSRHPWPTPTAEAAAEWVRVDGELEPCLNGIHACTGTRLVDWLDDELWEIELSSPIVEADGELVAAAGRLIRRIEHWNDELARAFVGRCIDNTVALAAESLSRAGRETEAEALTATRSEMGAALNAVQLAWNPEDEQTSPIVFLDDVARLERGGRPELAKEAPDGDAGGPAPAALAANLSYVCAHISAQLADQENPGAYNETFAHERRRQTTWLAETLRLEH